MKKNNIGNPAIMAMASNPTVAKSATEVVKGAADLGKSYFTGLFGFLKVVGIGMFSLILLLVIIKSIKTKTR